MTDNRPTVLFLCTHNAGRSQMALGFFNHLAGDQAVAWSGGSEPGDQINPAAVAAMAEVGIDITNEFPKPWTDEIVQAADVIVTMGCGDACPVFPGQRYEEWVLADPAGQPVEAVRPIRDEIELRVRALLAQLGVEPKSGHLSGERLTRLVTDRFPASDRFQSMISPRKLTLKPTCSRTVKRGKLSHARAELVAFGDLERPVIDA